VIISVKKVNTSRLFFSRMG